MVTTRRGGTTDGASSTASSQTKSAPKKHKEPKTADADTDGPQKKKAKATQEKTEDIDVDMTDTNTSKDDTTTKNTAATSTEAKQEEKDHAASSDPSSPIVEKGIVYFFLRGKVDISNPESMDEVKRSYILLRPLSPDQKLVDGKLPDKGNNRLLAVPKKRLPSEKGHERFLTFVMVPQGSLEEIRDQHLKGRTYETKTQGERTDFPAIPVAEGVYAFAKAEGERNSHFAYVLTKPEEVSEVQKDFGLKEKGAFVVSVRNPETPAPKGSGVPKPAEYPKEILEEFRGLKWDAVQSKHLDYRNAELLFIGEKHFTERGEHEATAEELEMLEEEDEKRIKHLKGDESVFADLELSKKEFEGIQSTWG